MRTFINGSICEAKGCSRVQHARGYCPKHYQTLRRTGSLTPLDDLGMGANATAAGPACYVCGRALMDHGLTEFCDLIDRRMSL